MKYTRADKTLRTLGVVTAWDDDKIINLYQEEEAGKDDECSDTRSSGEIGGSVG